jgi:hypothetical protein
VIPGPARAAPLLAFERGWRLKPRLKPRLKRSPPVRAWEKIADANYRAGRGMSTPQYSLREGVTLPAGFGEIFGCATRAVWRSTPNTSGYWTAFPRARAYLINNAGFRESTRCAKERSNQASLKAPKSKS